MTKPHQVKTGKRAFEEESASVHTTTLPDTVNNLPRLHSFYGREAELASIAEALEPEMRTWGALIDGPGGMGKTSLAIRAAELSPPGQFDSIFFLSAKERELTEDGERRLVGYVLPSILQMLNELADRLRRPELARLPEEDRIRELQNALRGQKVLLLLDNLETLTPEHRNQVFQFLSRLPMGCKAIITSRRRSDTDARIIRLDRLGKAAALQLLAELAADGPLLFKATLPERETLYEETGGNPLLMRWIAGQLGKGSCKTVAKALAFIRNAPANNDPLEFIFGDLLDTFSPSETKVLAALTYFTQRIETKLIAELAGIARAAARTALDDLTNRALVVPDEEDKQFALVPMVADFLRKKRPEVVAETGNRLEKRAYALIVENGYQKHERFPVLDTAWPSVAPALPLFVAGPNPRLQTVCAALSRFLNFTGRWDEWLALNLQAEGKAVAAGDHGQAGWHAKDAGFVHALRQQGDEVLASAARVAAHWTTAKLGVREQSYAIRLRSLGHQLKQDYSAALADARESFKLRRSLEVESEDVALALNDVAAIERKMEDFPAAERDYSEALRIAHAVGDAEGMAVYTGNLAVLALDMEAWARAEALAREALPLSERLGRKQLIAGHHYYLAKALVRQGKLIGALHHAQQAVALFIQLGSPELATAQALLKECQA